MIECPFYDTCFSPRRAEITITENSSQLGFLQLPIIASNCFSLFYVKHLKQCQAPSECLMCLYFFISHFVHALIFLNNCFLLSHLQHEKHCVKYSEVIKYLPLCRVFKTILHLVKKVRLTFRES